MTTSLQFLLCIVLTAGLIGCDFFSTNDNRRNPDETPGDQRILFEVEHVNFAWGHLHHGLYVDDEGSVWQYDISNATWQAARSDAYTLDELLDKYGHERELITTVPADELTEARSLIAPAARGALTEPVGRCADFGIVSFRAFRYETDDSLYHPILLYQAGDMARRNTSESASRLTSWLMTLDGSAPVEHCQP